MKMLYTTDLNIHQTTDGGINWEIISPDLTEFDKSKQDFQDPQQLEILQVKSFIVPYILLESQLTERFNLGRFE